MGINGTCFVCHGHSSPKAIKNAIRAAGEYVRGDLNRLLIEALRDNQELKMSGGGASSKLWEQIKEKVVH